MAFQLDHNIFFQGLNAQQNKQKMFLDSLAQGVEAGQNAQKLDMARRRIESGGDLPAAIQIGNEMQRLKNMASDSSLSEAERQEAMSRYNLIGQAGKTYGFDRGIEYGADSPGWNMLTGQPPPSQKPVFDYSQFEIPPVDESSLNAPAAAGGQVAPPPALQNTGDPALDAQRSRAFAQNTAMQNNAPALTPMAIPGWADAAGGIAATKKGMERQAEKDVDLDMNPQIARGEAQAKADVEIDTSRTIAKEQAAGRGEGEAATNEAKKTRQAENMLGILDEAEQVLGKASGGLVGAGLNSAKGMANISDETTRANEQLKTLSGWLVSHVPRMEGPQSDFDVDNYKVMAADLGNTMKPVGDRLAALKGLRELQQKYAHLNNGQDEAPEQAPSQGPKVGTKEGGYMFLGGDPSDPKRWQKVE